MPPVGKGLGGERAASCVCTYLCRGTFRDLYQGQAYQDVPYLEVGI